MSEHQITSLTVFLACGLALGLGCLSVIFGIPTWRSIRLADRVDPYVRSAEHRTRMYDALRGEVAAKPVASEFITWLATIMGRIAGGNETISRRIAAAGLLWTVQHYRIVQVLWSLAGLVIVFGLLLLIAMRNGHHVAGSLVLLPLGIIAGAMLKDWHLQQQIDKRRQSMLLEFPSVAELLALSVSAGESPSAALDRVARSCHGELVEEFIVMRNEVHAGLPFRDAMTAMARRINIAAVDKFVDGLLVAMERGSPLSDVLRAQAQDVREMSKRMLFESGGKRESLMLVPVVFLILPVVVMFAVFPGVVVFNLQM